MLRLTLRNLWAYKVRLALTGIAVVLGVAFMVGTTVLTDTMGRTFDTMFETTNAGVDVVVQQPAPVESEDAVLRDRMPAETLETIRSVDGVAGAEGTVMGFAQFVHADGSVSSLDGLGATIGTNWVDDEDLSPFSLAAGRAPEGTDEVVVDRATVEAQAWALGDEVTVLAKGEPVRLTLVGAATFGDIGGLPGSSLVAVDDEAAQRYFAEPGFYDAIAVAAADGVDPSELESEIDAALGAGRYDVVTGAADTAEKKGQFEESLSFFNRFLMAFALISLFVGTFIIYNTFSILVAQRTRDSAMLRAIGASRRQLLRSTLAESAAVGVVAGAIGLALGVAMSFALRALLAAAGLDLPDGETVVATDTIVTAFVIGVGVTVVSALGPALRGSRVPPIAALRDVAIDRSATSAARTVVGASMTAGGALAFAAGVVGEGGQVLMLLASGTVAVFLGVFVLGPVIARPIVRVLAVPFSRWGGTTGRLARENAVRSPKRTAATASALMVGVALVGLITILAASTKASISDAVDQSFRADYVVESGAWAEGGFSPELASTLAELPEVDTVSPYRSAPGEVDGRSATIDAIDAATIDEVFDLEVVAGAIVDVGDGSIAVSAGEAADHGLEVGDTVPVRFATGEVDLRVAALFDAQFPDGGYLVDDATLEAHVADQYDKKIFLTLESGVDPEAARAALEGALGAYPNAELLDQVGFKGDITSEIDAMLNLVYGLLALAVVIALIGIANTLALSVHERRREIGLLRAVGMTRGQVRSTVRRESVLIALLGTCLGTALAVAAAWGIVEALGDEVTTFAVPPVQLATIAALAAAAGVLAAFGPARRASNLDVLEAMAE